MREFSYDSDLTGGSLMVRESRVVADLLLNHSSKGQWNEAIIERNLLQKRSEASAIRNAQAIRKRLEKLEPEFLRALRDGDDELATQVSFVAALERNLLLVEFIESVVVDLFAIGETHLRHYLWFDFLDSRTDRDPSILDWKESSKKKMGQVAYRILAEAGFLESTKSLRLQRIVPRPELLAMLDDTHRQRLIRCMTLRS